MIYQSKIHCTKKSTTHFLLFFQNSLSIFKENFNNQQSLIDKRYKVSTWQWGHSEIITVSVDPAKNDQIFSLCNIMTKSKISKANWKPNLTLTTYPLFYQTNKYASYNSTGSTNSNSTMNVLDTNLTLRALSKTSRKNTRSLRPFLCKSAPKPSSSRGIWGM